MDKSRQDNPTDRCVTPWNQSALKRRRLARLHAEYDALAQTAMRCVREGNWDEAWTATERMTSILDELKQLHGEERKQ